MAEQTTLPSSFETSKDLLAVFHIQGPVTPGYSKIEYPGFEENDIYMPNYNNDLGGKMPDAGGQTAHVFEKLSEAAKSGRPSLMFAMSADTESTEPRVVEHEENAYVVYLPFSLYKEAGINPEDGKTVDGKTFIPKEVAMANRNELFPKIAQAATDFIRDNIPGYEEKNIVLDANYIDAGQTVLHAQELFREDEAIQQGGGNVTSVWTPHTLGVNKLNSLLSQTLKAVESQIESMDALDKDTKHDLYYHDALLAQYRSISMLIDSNMDPIDIAVQMKQLEGKESDGIAALDAKLKNIGADNEVREGIRNTLETRGMGALIKRYSLIDRLTMERGDNIKEFDGVMAVSEEMQGRVNDWTEHTLPVGFTRNGFNSTVYDVDVLNQASKEEVEEAVRGLFADAYDFGEQSQAATAVTDEQLEGTTFITISRPDPRKGSLLALEAFAKFAAEHPEEKGSLVMVSHKPQDPGNLSDDEERLLSKIDALEKETGVDLKSRVKLLPQLPTYKIRMIEQLPRSVGLAPSLNEPWGMVAIEQAGSGKPIIGSSFYAAAAQMKRDQVGQERETSVLTFPSPSETGVTRSQSVQAFADQMGEMSANFDSYNEAARDWAKDVKGQYQWSTAADNYLAFYNDVSDVIKSEQIDRKIAVFSDVDGTLVPNHDSENRIAHPDMNKLSNQMRAVREAGGVSVLSTGRTLPKIADDPLISDYPADFVIGSVGTKIYRKSEGGVMPVGKDGNRTIFDEPTADLIPTQEYEAYLKTPPERNQSAFEPGDVKKVANENTELRALGLEVKDATQDTGLRQSFFLDMPEGIDEVEVKRRFSTALGDMDHKVVVSFDPQHERYNVDVIPSKAGKDGATKWLLNYLERGDRHFDAAMVIDDSGNGKASMKPEIYRDHGINEMVFVAPANASDEVREHLELIQGEEGVSLKTFEPAAFDSPKGGPGAALGALKELLTSRAEDKNMNMQAEPETNVISTQGHEHLGKAINLENNKTYQAAI